MFSIELKFNIINYVSYKTANKFYSTVKHTYIEENAQNKPQHSSNSSRSSGSASERRIKTEGRNFCNENEERKKSFKLTWDTGIEKNMINKMRQQNVWIYTWMEKQNKTKLALIKKSFLHWFEFQENDTMQNEFPLPIAFTYFGIVEHFSI